jgi:hypothetical protein
MPMDFSNGRYISANGAESFSNSERVVSSTTKRSSIFNGKTSPQRMEKLFLTVLSWVGLGSYIGGILLNLSNWKSDILFLAGCGFMLLKFIKLTIRTWQSYRREEIEIKMLKKKSEHE